MDKNKAIKLLREAIEDYTERKASGMAIGSAFLRMLDALKETEGFDDT